uniref:Uncharacterized protein n=1 Tax=Oryza meridionalis TaxID=40149 RepID=A0A0E0EJY7_9ORYZ
MDGSGTPSRAGMDGLEEATAGGQGRGAEAGAGGGGQGAKTGRASFSLSQISMHLRRARTTSRWSAPGGQRPSIASIRRRQVEDERPVVSAVDGAAGRRRIPRRLEEQRTR